MFVAITSFILAIVSERLERKFFYQSLGPLKYHFHLFIFGVPKIAGASGLFHFGLIEMSKWNVWKYQEKIMLSKWKTEKWVVLFKSYNKILSLAVTFWYSKVLENIMVSCHLYNFFALCLESIMRLFVHGAFLFFKLKMMTTDTVEDLEGSGDHKVERILLPTYLPSDYFHLTAVRCIVSCHFGIQSGKIYFCCFTHCENRIVMLQ